MSKVKIIDKKSDKNIKYERQLLSHLRHPFIVNMHYAFQDTDNLYLVIDLLTGGDLRYHICKKRHFDEKQTKFMLCCLILGLQYIHSKRVIHRDIKPENLVLDDNGYIRITDFGISKVLTKNNIHETSGTPGYMAPEVMEGLKHSISVDYYALGVIGYEMMLGKRPYSGKTKKEIKEQMMSKQALIKAEDCPEGWSWEAMDFINKLMQRKPEKRLGYQGIFEVKNHPWIKCFPWKELSDKKLSSPYIPENSDNFDKRYCNHQEQLGLSTLLRYDNYKSDKNYNEIFLNYTYYPKYQNSRQKTAVKKRSQNSAFYPSKTAEHISTTITSQDLNVKGKMHFIKTKVKQITPLNINNFQVQNSISGHRTRAIQSGLVLSPSIKLHTNCLQVTTPNTSISTYYSNNLKQHSKSKDVFSLSKLLKDIRVSYQKGEKRENSQNFNRKINSINSNIKRPFSRDSCTTEILKKPLETPKGKIIGLVLKKVNNNCNKQNRKKSTESKKN